MSNTHFGFRKMGLGLEWVFHHAACRNSYGTSHRGGSQVLPSRVMQHYAVPFGSRGQKHRTKMTLEYHFHKTVTTCSCSKWHFTAPKYTWAEQNTLKWHAPHSGISPGSEYTLSSFPQSSMEASLAYYPHHGSKKNTKSLKQMMVATLTIQLSLDL